MPNVPSSLAVAACFAVASPALGQTFDLVADTRQNSQNLISFLGVGSLSNGGVVAFQAGGQQFDQQITGIYVGFANAAGASIDTAFERRTSVNSGSVFFSRPSINDGGVVVFGLSDDSGGNPAQTIESYSVSDFTSTTLVEDDNPFTFVDNGVINNAGRVFFTGFRADGTTPGVQQRGIFTLSDGTISPVVDQSTGSFIDDSPGVIAANDVGVVAFVTRQSEAGRSVVTGVSVARVGGGGQVTRLADRSGPISGFSSNVTLDVNDAGTVVFDASLDAGGAGLFVSQSGATANLLVDTSGVFSSFSTARVNDGGVIAFTAGLDTGGAGVFIGPDPVADRIIGPGDTFAGGTVVGASLIDLNDSGLLAFAASIDSNGDGRTDFSVVATGPAPVAVPEPASLSLLAVGGVALLRRRRAA